MTNLNATLRATALSALQSLPELFAWRAAQTPDAEAYRHFDGTRWCSTSWREAQFRIADFIRALAPLQLERGSRIAILLPNGLHAVCMDQATLALGHVPVPMHALDNPASIAYILADSAASFLIAASDAQWQAIAETGVALPALRQVVVLEKTGVALSADHVVLTLSEWLSQAGVLDVTMPAFPQPDELAALVYTSGTTGKPKGVMLTHRNVLSNVKAVAQRMSPVLEDVFLSFLPLSHTFERTAGYYLPIVAGSCVAFSRSTKQLQQDFLEVRPTLLISVPRVYERVYSAIQSKIAPSKLQSSMFNLAVAIGWRRFERSQKLRSDGPFLRSFDALLDPLMQTLVASKLQSQFGGRLRIAVSGGAALSQTISRCFLGLGIQIIQGYGMTESSPVVSFNAPDDNDPATVGRVLDGVEVQIGENKELLVRGENIMRGYWKREEDTAKALADGWLHTGDQAAVVDGRVRILGRVKEIIVTSTGEKIAPVDLEIAIGANPVFEQVYVFGDNHPFIACAVVLSRSYWQELATSLNLAPDNPDSLQSGSAIEKVIKTIRELTSSFPYYAQPKVVILSLEPWTVENTLITPTLKLKRNNLAGYFAKDIERIYQR